MRLRIGSGNSRNLLGLRHRCRTEIYQHWLRISHIPGSRRGTVSYIHMFIRGEKGYTFFSSNYIDNVRFFTLFQYENSFYYAASCRDEHTGMVNLQMFMLNRNIFKQRNIADSVCFDRIFHISEPYLLYNNETHPDISLVKRYLEEVIYDVIYTNRANTTFYGEEWVFRNEELPFLNDDAVYGGDKTEDRAIDWRHMYIMDINNDGKDEIFTITPPGYQQPREHSIKWNDEEYKQCRAKAGTWKDDDYRLADIRFKEFNRKTVMFTLYQEIQSGRRYLIDAIIQDRDEATILMDYMIELEPAGIQVTEFGVGMDVPIYKLLKYQDPDLESAFPYNLEQMAEVFRLKVQGLSATIKNNWVDIPDDFTEILSGLLTSNALDLVEDGMGMEPYEVDKDAFYKKYGAYINDGEHTMDGGIRYVYRIAAGSTDYFLLQQSIGEGKIGDLHIYRETAGGLSYVSTYYPEYWGTKVIEHSGALYIVERPFGIYGYPRHLDNISVRRLIPEGGQDAVIEALPETFRWQKIYDNHAAYEEGVTGYLEEIKKDLMELSYYIKDEDSCYLGDESPEIDLDKLLRLGSISSPYDSFYTIDFNNDQKEEYISKSRSYGSIFTSIYQFTGRGAISLGYDEAAGDNLGRPVQLWFKEIDGRVFTFRLFYSEDFYYILNVSLIEDTVITQVQTHIIVPKVHYVMNAVGALWRDAYAQLLRDSPDEYFYLCDIDGNNIPELLIGGPSTDTDKYADYDVYTYRNNKAECLGTVGTLNQEGNLWLDESGGILGYSYGAGSGGTDRHYIENGVLYEDGDVHGYYFDSRGNLIEWFRGNDGNKVIVDDETKDEYDRIRKSETELQRHTITEEEISAVIYGD